MGGYPERDGAAAAAVGLGQAYYEVGFQFLIKMFKEMTEFCEFQYTN